MTHNHPYEMFNSEPLAFLFTWTTYGTWLPGDERGWTGYRQGFKSADATRRQRVAARLGEQPCTLTMDQRKMVERTIRAHAELKCWHIHALNCRSNHVHVVVTSRLMPDEIMRQLKSWCTRRLKEQAAGQSNDAGFSRQNWWTQRGSGRFLNDPKSVEAAIVYVRDAQDFPR